MIENKRFNSDLFMMTSYIRTIFRDFDEHILKIDLFESKLNKTSIILKDGNIEHYSSVKTIFLNNKNIIVEIKKDENGKISFSINNNQTIECLDNMDEIGKLVTKELQKIKSIKNINPKIKLDIYDRLLCQIYQLFYNEYPDFSSKYINRKVQSMMYLLNEYGVSMK